jgi:hypothetical protein
MLYYGLSHHSFIHSCLNVIFRLLSVHDVAPKGLGDILFSVHYINVMRDLELMKITEFP